MRIRWRAIGFCPNKERVEKTSTLPKAYASWILSALSRPSRPERSSNVTFWLSARPVVYDLLRREARRQQREQRHVTEGSAQPDESIELDRAARIAWLEDQLDKLDDEAASLLRMRYRLGWTLARIGRALGIKTGAVDGKVRRLIRQLQQDAENAFDDRLVNRD